MISDKRRGSPAYGGAILPMRRVLCMLVLVALMMTAIPQPSLAISGQEALFGSASTADSDGEEALVDADDDGEAYDMYAGTETTSTDGYPTLKLGDRDGDDSTAYIVFMQNRLIELGYLRDSADGTYGENTQTAVLAFQKNNNLPETGIADGETQALLYSDISKLVPAAEDSTMFGGEVTRVQTALGQWGFYEGAVDGKAGSGTEKAIRRFKQYMLEIDPTFGTTPTPAPTATPNPDGRFGDMPVVMDLPLVDESTQNLSNAAITPELMEYVDGDKGFTIYRQTVAKGDTGSEPMRVQTRLHQLKYVYSTDGVFGEMSELGLKYFQRKNGLPETGIADEATQNILFSARALEGEEYVFPYKLVVDVSQQKVYVGKWNGTTYKGPYKTFPCATGKKETPTPIGTYQAGGKTGNEWYYFKDFGCWAKWAYQIVGGILFHSNTVSKRGDKPHDGGLGHRASHGCIRMRVDDAKWIYDNCPEGTTVVVQE